jgi:hypothetical protein
MRWIEKPADPPPSIRDYVAAQSPVGHGLSYPTFASSGAPGGGSWGGQLRRELTAEQYGLCAYTGAGIDERLGRLGDPAGRLKFSAHNEHLKPQSLCRQELEASGGRYDRDLAEDMDHRNIVAALLVGGAGNGAGKISPRDLFGASHRESDPVPVRPTDPTCEQRFTFDLEGGIAASAPADQDAKDTIAVLQLDHETLAGWRAQAVRTFVDGIQCRADAELILVRIDTPSSGRLPEYCFAIRGVVRSLLAQWPAGSSAEPTA